MQGDMNHEILLIKTFVIKDRQERYLNLIATEKGRKKFRTYLSHFRDLNSKLCSSLHTLQSASELHDILKSAGAGDLCYIISENSKYDMRSLPVMDATKQLFNSGIAFFLSCIPGKLAYYEGEDTNQRFILRA